MSFVLPLRLFYRVAGFAALGVFAGCASVVAPPPSAQATYDLGPMVFDDSRSGRGAVVVVVPPRLDQPLMRYRLSYADPHEVRAYTRSRWEAPPGRLLGERFAQAWPGPDLGDCRLVVSVDEWIHDFAAPDRSRVLLALDARLEDRDGRQLAQRRFHSEVAATRHDAPGMAAASREAVANVLRGMSTWLTADGRPTAAAACLRR